MSNILPHSGIAACNFNDHIRIYFQAYNGQLLETYTDDGVNFNRSSAPLPAPATPKTFTPLAATTYHDGAEIRVYYLTTDFYLQELCWSANRSGWYAGALNDLKVKTASYSNLAVVHWDEKFRVYYQNSNNEIRELVNDGPKWVDGAKLSTAVAGTKLAAIRTPDGNLRIYYQNRDFQTRQLTSKNNWGDDTEIATAHTFPHSAFGIINVNATKPDLRLYVGEGGGNSNKYGELSNGTGDTHSWSGVKTLSNNLPTGNIASVTWGNVREIRVYSQVQGNDIVEYRWQPGGWKKGHHIPTA